MQTEDRKEMTLPDFLGKSTNLAVSSKTYRVRYLKADLGDPTQLGELESLMTRGMDGEDIVLSASEKFIFQDRFFIVVTYLEKRSD